jgi:drug/metabolite transporter (DMT)-like permease
MNAIPHLGELAALGTAFCWTVTALAFESASLRVGSLSVNLIRLVFASLLLAGFNFAVRGLPLPTDASPEVCGWMTASGLIGFTFGDLCLFRALMLIGARLTMLITALVPPLTAIIGFAALGERLSMFGIVGMALTVGGIAFVVLERRASFADAIGRKQRRTGILLAMGSAMGQAVGLILSKRGLAGGYDAFAATQIRVLAGLAGFAAIFFAVHWWGRVVAACKDKPAMARMGLGAIFGPFLGVSLSLVAIAHTEAGVAATIMAIVPVLIIPPSVWLKKEKVSPRAVIGAVIAVAGVALMFL